MANKKYHHIRLNAAFQSDLMWLHTFLAKWNGVAMIPGAPDAKPVIEVFTDASGGVGCGAWWSPRWLQLKWSPGQPFGKLPITQKEMVLACVVWGNEWRERRMIAHCDNEAAVAVLNSGYSRESHIMHLLRCYFLSRHFIR